MRSTRRQFCVTAVGGLSAATLASGGSATIPKSDGLNVVEVERSRVLRAARRYLRDRPVTITAYRTARSSGGKHDYFSEGDYWWPDPDHPDGP